MNYPIFQIVVISQYELIYWGLKHRYIPEYGSGARIWKLPPNTKITAKPIQNNKAVVNIYTDK